MRSCPLAFSDKRTDNMYSVTALSPRGTRKLLIGFVFTGERWRRLFDVEIELVDAPLFDIQSRSSKSCYINGNLPPL